MNTTSNRLAVGGKRNSTDFARNEFSNIENDAENPDHRYNNESLEQDLSAVSSDCAQAHPDYWKHRKEIRDRLSRNSYTNLKSLDPVHLHSLTQLVENYNEAIEETATFSRAKAQKAAQQLIARQGTNTSPDEKEILAMIVGTGDAMDAKALMRRQLSIAESPNATPEILAELAMSNFAEVREAVMDHALCPVSIHLMLAEDECSDVRFAMAENHNLSFSVLEKLSHDDNPFVSMRAERTMRRVLFDNVVCMEAPELYDDDEGHSAAIG